MIQLCVTLTTRLLAGGSSNHLQVFIERTCPLQMLSIKVSQSYQYDKASGSTVRKALLVNLSQHYSYYITVKMYERI